MFADALAALERELKARLPEDYRDFLSSIDGLVGRYGEDRRYVDLWPGSDLLARNRDYMVDEFAPGLLIFGSDGGDTAFAFDMRRLPWRVVQVPFVGMGTDETRPLAPSFGDFLRDLGDPTFAPASEQGSDGR
jgi:hypothetical protein